MSRLEVRLALGIAALIVLIWATGIAVAATSLGRW